MDNCRLIKFKRLPNPSRLMMDSILLPLPNRRNIIFFRKKKTRKGQVIRTTTHKCQSQFRTATRSANPQPTPQRPKCSIHFPAPADSPNAVGSCTNPKINPYHSCDKFYEHSSSVSPARTTTLGFGNKYEFTKE